jgi:tRNA(Ile)-lysidine synthase
MLRQNTQKSPARNPIKTSVVCYRDEQGIIYIGYGEQSAAFSGDVLDIDTNSHTGQITFAGLQINWTVRNSPGKALPERIPCQEHFDADLVGSRIRLRHWRPGDRFQPIGMSQTVKLQDLFTNQKVPHAKRRRLVVAITVQGEIFWVENQRISERFKLTKATVRRLHWRWQRP